MIFCNMCLKEIKFGMTATVDTEYNQVFCSHECQNLWRNRIRILKIEQLTREEYSGLIAMLEDKINEVESERNFGEYLEELKTTQKKLEVLIKFAKRTE